MARRPNQGARVIVPTVEMRVVVRQDLPGMGNGPGQLRDLHILIARRMLVERLDEHGPG